MTQTQGGSFSSYTLLIASVAAIGGFLFGFDSGVINGTVSALSEAFGSDSVGTGFSVASMLLGCALGAFIAGPLADKWGRKPLMAATAIGFAVSAWGSGVADSQIEFILYRLLGGVAVGGASVLAPVYISEIAPAHLRGRLASLQQLAIVLGLFAAFVSNYILAAQAGGAKAELWMGFATWRWMFWMEIIPALAFLIGAMVIPESPRYLVRAGDADTARGIFAKIASEDPQCLVDAVKKSLSTEKPALFRDLIDKTSGKIFPIVWVGIILSVFQQFVGINVVFYYGEVLWRAAGFTESEALQVNLLGGTVNVLSTFVAISLIDKIGRKPLLIAGSIGMASTLATLAFCFSQGELGDGGALQLSSSLSIIALVAANLYVFCFGVSWGPCVWVLLGEMFPNQIRGAALSIGAGAQWIANFAIAMTFPIMLSGIGLAGAYGTYAFFAALSLVFVWKFVKETRGRSLEQMSGQAD